MIQIINEFMDIVQQINTKTDKQKAKLFNITLFLLFLSSYQTFISPIFYIDPVFICKSGPNQTYPCSQQQACNQFYQSHQIDISSLTEHHTFDFSEIIDHKASPDSMTTRFQLVCNKKFVKIELIKQFFRGSMIAFIIQILIKINSKIVRKCYIIILMLIILIASLLIIYVDNLWLNNYGFMAKQFARQSMHTICFDFVKDYYTAEYLQYYQLLQNIGYTSAMFIFPIITISTNNSYYYLVAITAVLELLFVPSFIYLSIGIVVDKNKTQKQIISINYNQWPIQTNLNQFISIFRPLSLNFIIVLFNVFVHRLHFSVCILYLDFSQYPNMMLIAQGLLSLYFGIKINKMVSNGNEYSLYIKTIKITAIILLSIGFISPTNQFNTPSLAYLYEFLFFLAFSINSINQTLTYISIPRFLEPQNFSILFNLGSIFQRVFLDLFLAEMYYLRQSCDIQVIAGLSIMMVLIYLANYKLNHSYPQIIDSQNIQSMVSSFCYYSLSNNIDCMTILSSNVWYSRYQKPSSIMLQDFTSFYDNRGRDQKEFRASQVDQTQNNNKVQIKAKTFKNIQYI